MPLTNSYFEVKMVEVHDPFYQLGKLYVYKLRCELFQYSSEEFNTGNPDVDKIEEASLDMQNAGIALETGDALLLDTTLYGDVSKLLNEDFDVTANDPQADNSEFNRLASIDILDFTEINPFGEVAVQ